MMPRARGAPQQITTNLKRSCLQATKEEDGRGSRIALGGDAAYGNSMQIS